MRLTPRLKTIADLIDGSDKMADVGTDHAYLPVYLLRNGKAKNAIAADVNQGPLNNAKSTIAQFGLSDDIETRLGSGIEPIEPGEIDTLVVAGMGGLLIRDILSYDMGKLKTINKLILQPMIAQDELRKWLIINGFKIIDERLAQEEEKLYEIIVAEKGEETIENDIYFEVGKRLIENKDPLLQEFLRRKLKKYTDIYNSVKNQDSEKAISKRKECEAKIETLKEVIEGASE